jgi:ribosome maturation factor RimP
MNAEELKLLIEPVLEGLGIDLVELIVHRTGSRTIVRALVDEAGGISINRITQASRALADQLDQKNAMAMRYTLEVSSPGVDRPLQTERDFARHLQRTVQISYEGGEAVDTLTGTIVAVSAGVVTLQTENEEKKIELGRIKSAVIQVKF